MWEKLEWLRALLLDLDVVKTCEIGLEDGISPADFPIVRIEPETYVLGRPYGSETGTVNIVFGMPFAESQGLSVVLRKMHEMRTELLDAMRGQSQVRVIRTVWFERRDAVPYKLAAIVVELGGAL